MKTNISLFINTLFFFSILFISCNNDGDTTPPVINLISPAEEATLEIAEGNQIHFKASFSDNEALASYSVEIHNNFDDHGHSHIHASTKAEQTATKTFSYFNSWNDIAGKENTSVEHYEIEIPANATPGKYHLIVYCTDASGNEAHVARNITLSNHAEDEGHEHKH